MVRQWRVGNYPIPDNIGEWLAAVSAPLGELPTPVFKDRRRALQEGKQ
jgi:hypothetical protein